jgi:7,8-dihydropterin-6-yl-methyl-4-(beta-D-ribofuranosyl)aminobenzene 5'-phosphate synthase
MQTPVAVDCLEILVLVDNSTDFLSTTSADAESEISRFWRRGARLQAGHLLCCAAHGFSCAITVRAGDITRTLLFDAGPDGAVLTNNAERLGFDMGSVDALFLSHGHWDHAGGMLAALNSICDAKGGRKVPTFMHPDMYRSRGMKAPDGSIRRFADVPGPSTLEAHGASVVHESGPQTVLDDLSTEQ